MIHVAGYPMVYGLVFRQRCAWCGAMLFEETASGRPPTEVHPGAFIDLTVADRPSLVVASLADLPRATCLGAT